ncbi:MAG: DUF3788 family protein [Planctomycetota bacterium]|jgi:hypothetical protein
MPGSFFSDKERQPTTSDLRKALGQKYSLWTLIRKGFNKKHSGDDLEWKYYGKKNGWLAKNIVKKRNIFFLIPLEGSFRLSFTFGDKAVEVINKSDLPESIVKLVNKSRKYAEGRVIQLEVKDTSDCQMIELLIDIKCAN